MRKRTLAGAAALALASGVIGLVPASADTGIGHATTAGKDRQFGRVECQYGWLCTFHNGVYKSFTACTTQYLSGWTGSGEIMNNQTTGTKTTFYKLNGSVYTTSTAYQLTGINWDQIWSIKVC